MITQVAVQVAVTASLLGLLTTLPARADIVEWQDTNGVRHFTNVREDLPSGRTTQVVVVEPVVVEPAEVASAPAAESPRQAQVVYDRAVVTDAYAEGLERGLVLASQNAATAAGARPAPLAAIVPTYVPIAYPAYADEPLVTSAFDRGRSRHLTRRMQLQEQFQRERDARLGDEAPRFIGAPHGCAPGRRVLFR